MVSGAGAEKFINILIVGGGRDCAELLGIAGRFGEIRVAAVVEKDEKEPGAVLAKSMGIPVSKEWEDIVRKPGLDAVVELTGLADVRQKICSILPATCSFISSEVAGLLWNIAVIHQRLEKDLFDLTSKYSAMISERDKRNAAMMSILEDIEAAQNAVAAEREKMATVISSMTNGIVLISSQGHVLLSNEAARVFFGVKNRELVRDDIQAAQWFPAEQLLSFHEKGHKKSFDLVLHEEPARIVNALLISLEREGVLCVLTDVTRERELDRAKDELLATVSHELRTPLALIKLFFSNVRAGVMGSVDERICDGISRSDAAVDRLAVLIEGLLDFSRLKKGKIKLRVESVSIMHIVKSVCEMYESSITDSNRKFSVTAHVSDPVLRADQQKVYQVISNLLDNAMKFTKEGGHITLAVKDTPQHIEVSVSDDGEGIPKEYHRLIFERFRQIGRKYGPGTHGLGLGLSICKEIIDRHGGRIWVESEPGKGSTFNFVLPREGPEESSGDAQAPGDLSMT